MPKLFRRFAPLLGISLTVVLACAPPPGEPAPASPQVAARQVHERLEHGVDISEHSGGVDWAKLAAAGHSFAFVKATEGMDLKDPVFAYHWEEMRKVGVIRGAYHFYVTEDDPVAQATFFIDNVELEPGDLAPVVDIELIGHHSAKTGLAEDLKVFLDQLEKHYRIKPIIYTTANFWDAHFNDQFGEYPLWVAEYEVDEPRLPIGWRQWHIWQWKGDAEVEGVEKGADLSHVNRLHSDVDLAALVIPAAPAASD